MAGISFGLFVISCLLIFGGVNYFLASKRTGVYPPRKVLQERAFVLGGAGGMFLFLAIIIFWVN